MNTAVAQYDAAACDMLKSAVVQRYTGADVGTQFEAAQQIIRTQVEPSVYEVVRYLSGVMHQRGARFIRLVAEWMGYGALADAAPELHDFLFEYQYGRSDAEQSAQLFRECACIVAAYEADILEQLFAAVVAAQTSVLLHERLVNPIQPHVSRQAFADEWELLQRQSRSEQVHQRQPRYTYAVQPAHVPVRTTDGIVHYRVPAQVRIFDPRAREFDVQLAQPVPVQQYSVDRTVSVPWDRAQHGLQIEVALPDCHGGHHAPERFYLTEEHLLDMHQRGSAVATRIGQHEEYRLYPEYIQPALHEPHPLPDHALVAIRVARSQVHITRLDPDIELTVFA